MKIKYTITGVDCPNCAAKLAKIIEEKQGVESAKINFLTEKLTVETTLTETDLYQLITKSAYAFDKGIKIEK